MGLRKGVSKELGELLINFVFPNPASISTYAEFGSGKTHSLNKSLTNVNIYCNTRGSNFTTILPKTPN